MSREYYAAGIMFLVGATIGVSSLLIRRGHHRLIAGFDESKVVDADGLGRSIGRDGLLFGGACLLGAGLVVLFPNWMRPVEVTLGLAAALATVRSVAVCSRHARRS